MMAQPLALSYRLIHPPFILLLHPCNSSQGVVLILWPLLLGPLIRSIAATLQRLGALSGRDRQAGNRGRLRAVTR